MEKFGETVSTDKEEEEEEDEGIAVVQKREEKKKKKKIKSSSPPLFSAMENSTSLSSSMITHPFGNGNGGIYSDWITDVKYNSTLETFSFIELNDSSPETFLNRGLGVFYGREKKFSCGQWEPAQHNLFQFSNMCFLSAFAVPRHYKSSVLLFRFLLCFSFLITALWAGVYVCAFDSFIWSSLLATVNGTHAIVLIYRFLPPALSLELTELYMKSFKPLKVSKKHFKELTKEASLVKLIQDEAYAREDITPADEHLSILLKGKMKVTTNGTFMHNISCYQFIDSPEFRGNTTASGIRFQVTITAEEDCLYMCWSRIRLDRILRHRPHMKFILDCLIGKDITLKMYSLNEQVGHICTTEAMSRAAKEDHWRKAINRSMSVDAVNVGTKGHVRSNAWKQLEKQNRKHSIYSESESPLLGQQQCWMPVVASQFPIEYPFAKQEVDSQDEEREPMLPKSNPSQQQQVEQSQQQIQVINPQQVSNMNATFLQQLPILGVPTSSHSSLLSQPIALIPVILPVLTAPVTSAASSSSSSVAAPSPSRPVLKHSRGVKFDETCL